MGGDGLAWHAQLPFDTETLHTNDAD